ncbi:MAG: hypothetical protein ABEH59_02135 [Halobacteriales archaeon]
MTQARAADPNPIVREVYDDLGRLLDEGDDVFIEEGPALLKEAIARDGFFRNLTSTHE